ncbi:MAG: hypothetical protein IJH36_02290 [Clostridia bacterium]|nr:hypothetical protein [Clostridia bacterium]MBQ7718057.1 hypothetical protein [Clostridia bacterium]
MKSKIPPVNNYAAFVVLPKPQEETSEKIKKNFVKIIAREMSNYTWN